MRPLWKDMLIAVWLGMLLPGIALNAFVLRETRMQMQPMQSESKQTVQKSNSTIPVRDPDRTCVSMALDSYLTGVLLAEIPAEFHEEALKAQSVAARTYGWKAYTTGGKHGDGSVCMDSSCCQAYLSEESYLAGGGTQEALKKIRQAVQATTGMVLVYDGELIEATYFSSTGGSTEAALAVWGADYPYLQSVASPEEVREHSISYTPEEFQDLLGKALTGSPEDWFGPVAYTAGGGVDRMEICGETYTGVHLRKLLGLRSTDFSIETGSGNITITTQGYGHRVGMSQYGAEALAEDGSTWQQILQHYYPGTTIVPAA